MRGSMSQPIQNKKAMCQSMNQFSNIMTQLKKYQDAHQTQNRLNGTSPLTRRHKDVNLITCLESQSNTIDRKVRNYITSKT